MVARLDFCAHAQDRREPNSSVAAKFGKILKPVKSRRAFEQSNFGVLGDMLNLLGVERTRERIAILAGALVKQACSHDIAFGQLFVAHLYETDRPFAILRRHGLDARLWRLSASLRAFTHPRPQDRCRGRRACIARHGELASVALVSASTEPSMDTS